MERMGTSNSLPVCCKCNLYVLIERKLDNTSTWKKILSILSSAHDLKEDRDVGWNKRGIVDSKQAGILCP